MKGTFLLLILGLIGMQPGAARAAESVVLFDVTDTSNLRRYTRNACEIGVVEFNGSKVLEVRYGHNTDWPNIFFRQKIFAFSDWSAYNVLAITVTNPTEDMVIVNIRVDDASDHLRQGGYSLGPGKTVKLYMDMSLTQNKIPGMRGQPPGLALDKEEGAWTDDNQAPIDASNISAFQVFMAKPSISHRIYIHRIELLKFPLSEQGKVAAFVDRFGQYNGASWPGKLNDEPEFEQRLRSEAADLENNPPPPDRDGYGGWKEGPKLEPSGHFRVEKHNGKWCFVDPDGYLFWSSGVDCVGASEATTVAGREAYFTWLPSKKKDTADPERPRDPLLAFYGQGTYDFFAANLFRKYGRSYRKLYFEISAKRLLSWGFNTVGNWSDINALRKLLVPYTASASSGMAAQFKVDNRDFPDVFHPGFAEGVGKSLKGLARFKDDPWFLGVFIDNEFTWYPNGKLAAIVLEQGSGCYTKTEAAAYLERKFGSIDKLNDSWHTRLESWDNLAGQPLRLNEQQQNAARRDLVEFEGMMASQYFGKCREMMDKYLPGILYFGSRFSSFSREVVEPAKKYCDAVCFNIYAELPTDNEGDELAKEMDFPILVGEFHFGALDRGMFHTGLRAARDQNERARKLENYIRAAVTHPNFVGTHWFQFVDESLTGRWFDGENYNIGFLTVTDDPYPEMRSGARSINKELYKLRSAK